MQNKWFKDIFSKMFLNKVIFYGNNVNEKCIAITFDDGPHPQNTEKILEILRQEGVKATFFLIGQEIDKFPEFTKRYIDEGHEIGNHSYYHNHLVRIKEVNDTSGLIYKNVSIMPKFFRPPYGKITPILLFYMLIKKMTLVMWSVDSNDSTLKSADGLKDFLKSLEIKRGDIILFHEDYSHVQEALRDIIKDIKNRGFSFVTIGEILRK